MRDPMLKQAIAAYEAIDDLALKLELAREIALTRGAELTLAYRNVVMVASGFKRKKKAGKQALLEVPCVILVVRRKVAKADLALSAAQFIPRHLLALATWQGERVLVAVPTDVQAESFHWAGAAQSLREIYANPPADEYGALAALVDVRENGATQRYGLTAQHVLSPNFVAAGTKARKGRVVDRADGRPQPASAPSIGRSSKVGGVIVEGPSRKSFDAQLIELDDETQAARMLGSLPLDPNEPFVAGHPRLAALIAQGRPFEIRVADNHPLVSGPRPRMFGQFHRWMPPTLGIKYRSADDDLFFVHHEELVEVECLGADSTIGGDSGSLVVMWLDNQHCTIVGMHVSGSGPFARMLPAWHVFDAARYNGLAPGASIQPVPIP